MAQGKGRGGDRHARSEGSRPLGEVKQLIATYMHAEKQINDAYLSDIRKARTCQECRVVGLHGERELGAREEAAPPRDRAEENLHLLQERVLRAVDGNWRENGRGKYWRDTYMRGQRDSEL